MKVRNFQEYWIYHLSNHKQKLTRNLHLFGFCLYLISWLPGLYFMDWRYIVFSLLAGYILSSFTHKFIEKSPINLKHPYWGLIATLKMFHLMIKSEMNEEMIRVFGKVDPRPEDTFQLRILR